MANYFAPATQEKEFDFLMFHYLFGEVTRDSIGGDCKSLSSATVGASPTFPIAHSGWVNIPLDKLLKVVYN